MKKALALSLLALVPGLAPAAEITEYDTRVVVDSDGRGHAVCTLVIDGDPSETVVVPLAHGAWTDFRLVEATEGLRLEPPKAKATTVQVNLPAASSAASRVSFSFEVPEVFARDQEPVAGAKRTRPRESRTIRYAFVNSQVTLIKDFRMLLTLPEGYRFQAIREQLPKQTKSEAEPRVRLGGEAGRQNALLRLANLVQGDDTSMQLEAVPSRRSPLWLLSGLVLSALYLAYFRDLVSRTPRSTEPR